MGILIKLPPSFKKRLKFFFYKCLQIRISYWTVQSGGCERGGTWEDKRFGRGKGALYKHKIFLFELVEK